MINKTRTSLPDAFQAPPTSYKNAAPTLSNKAKSEIKLGPEASQTLNDAVEKYFLQGNFSKAQLRKHLHNQQQSNNSHQQLSGDILEHLFDESTPLNWDVARKAFQQILIPNTVKSELSPAQKNVIDEVTKAVTLKKVPVYYANIKRHLPVKSHGYLVAGNLGLREKSGAKVYDIIGDPMRAKVDVNQSFIKKAAKQNLPKEAKNALKQLKGSSFKTLEAFHQAYATHRIKSGEVSENQISQESRAICRGLLKSNMEVWLRPQSSLFSDQGISAHHLSQVIKKKSDISTEIKNTLKSMADHQPKTYFNETEFHRDYATQRKALADTSISEKQIGQELSRIYRLPKSNTIEKDIRAFEQNSQKLSLKRINHISNLDLLEKRNQTLLHQRYVDEKLGRAGIGLAVTHEHQASTSDETDIFKYVPRFSYLPTSKGQANCNAGAATFANSILKGRGFKPIHSASLSALGVGHTTRNWEPIPKAKPVILKSGNTQ